MGQVHRLLKKTYVASLKFFLGKSLALTSCQGAFGRSNTKRAICSTEPASSHFIGPSHISFAAFCDSKTFFVRPSTDATTGLLACVIQTFRGTSPGKLCSQYATAMARPSVMPLAEHR